MTETATPAIPAIERTLVLAAAPSRVWRAISDPAELAQWLPERAAWDLRPGGAGSFFWEGYGSYAVELEAVDAPRYLAWRWSMEAVSDTTTLVEW